jgi:SAM-dependent methyltransferase
MLRGLVDALAARPRVFDALRWVLEGGYAGHLAVIEEQLRPASGAVLDIGCGTGVFATEFDPADYLGIDISLTYIRAAGRKDARHRFAVMDARRLELPDHSQQRCFISGMLHHLSDDDVDAVLRETVRVLVPSGRLVIWEDVPTRSSWNLVGRAIHALDLGDSIRSPEGYRRLIEPWFAIESEFPMQSGCMDYVVFRCAVK